MSLFRLWQRERGRQEVASVNCTEGDVLKWESDIWDTQMAAVLLDPSLQCGEKKRKVSCARLLLESDTLLYLLLNATHLFVRLVNIETVL